MSFILSVRIHIQTQRQTSISESKWRQSQRDKSP